MKHLFSFLILSCISLTVCSQTSGAYTNMEGRYTITPLSGWKVRATGSETSVYAPPDGGMDQWDEKLEISITDGENIELNHAFDFYINTDFPEAYEKFNIVNQGLEEINGLKAKWARFTFSAQGRAAGATGSGDSIVSETLMAVFYVIKKDNSLYLINGVAEKKLFPKFETSFRSIIRTFRVKE